MKTRILIRVITLSVAGTLQLTGARLHAAESTNPADPSHTIVPGPARPRVPAPGDLPMLGQLYSRNTLLQPARDEGTWLGVAVEESPQVLASQLSLDPGVGLVITHVVSNSPAANAGLKENDVLVELEGNPLVHPAQLKKLVQVRKEGDTVGVVFYRAGKKESITITLGTTTDRQAWLDGQELRIPGIGMPTPPRPIRVPGMTTEDVRAFERLRRESGAAQDPYSEQFHQQMEKLQRSLDDLRLNEDAVKQEVRRSVEHAREAAQEALRHSSDATRQFGPAADALRQVARGWAGLNDNATITIQNSGENAVRSTVYSDNSGTYIIVASPEKRLTARDRSGNVRFDGLIDTPEQQQKVPRDIWERVQPLADKMP